tara:strand:- start:4937 stop:5146 length:210 start_codon:yes stop_codon:yes gene_type:complete
MGEVAKITDGVAICISDRSLLEMGQVAARRLDYDVKKTIEDAGMSWRIERDEERRESRIVPVSTEEPAE